MPSRTKSQKIRGPRHTEQDILIYHPHRRITAAPWTDFDAMNKPLDPRSWTTEQPGLDIWSNGSHFQRAGDVSKSIRGFAPARRLDQPCIA